MRARASDRRARARRAVGETLGREHETAARGLHCGRVMNRNVIALLSIIFFGSVTLGCAVDGTSDEHDEHDEGGNVGTAREALISGTADTGGTTDPTTGTVAEKPKFDVESCITTNMLLNGWSRLHAKSYCECRAKGYSDQRCVNTIPFIDL